MGGGQSTPAPPPPPPPPKIHFSQPWRDVKTGYLKNYTFLNSYKPGHPDVKDLRILLHGPVGAGKSSFINSVQSALRDRVAISAQTDATSGSSFTRKYETYEIKKEDGSYCSFIFNDIMGLEEKTDMGVKVEDVKLALKGHVSKGYQVDKFSVLLGISPNCIFLVRNYHEEIDTNDDMNALILTAVKQMICFGEDFVDKL